MRYLLLVVLLFCGYVLAAASPITFSDIRYRAGSEVDWRTGFPQATGSFTIQAKVKLPARLDTSEAQALVIFFLASAEVYWDGRLLGHNGTVGDSPTSEIPGRMRSRFLLPEAWLTAGEHQLELQVSNWHAGGKVRFYGFWLEPYLTPVVERLRTTALLYGYAGCFLFIGLFYLFRFLHLRPRPELAVFSVLCLAFAALLVMEYLRTYCFYAYPWHFTRLRIIMGISQLIGVTLPVFFALRFGLSRWGRYLAPLAIIFPFLLWYSQFTFDYATNLSVFTGCLFASGIAGWAASQGKTGSRLALWGILPLTLALLFFPMYYDYLLYIGFGNLVLLTLVSLARRERELREERETALLTSTRLELELLRKNLQPHFLMNSISSAVDWIEENPAKGVELLLALAEEAEILLASAAQQCIPLEREIALCRHHLRVMGFRHLQEYTFEVSRFPPGLTLPPAILLTLVENGLSHQVTPAFTLTVEVDAKRVIYQFLSQGETSRGQETLSSGTGLRYVQARLREAYGEEWALEQGPVTAGWATRIVIGAPPP
ncbi:MAG: histidine kinase [Bacteroidota bacterium]